MIKGRVSIIIPHYNQLDYLEQAISSAKAQTYEDIEIVVVDDASTQNPRSLMQRHVSTWCHIVSHTNNLGLSAARNTGIQYASGEWILPLDADDMIDKRYVEKAVNANTDIVSSWLQYFGRYNATFRPEPHYDYQDFLVRNRINCCSMFRKEMWEKIGGYDQNMKLGFEDWEFWIRATKAGYKVVVLQEPLFLYRKKGYASMIDNALKKKSEIVAYMKTKHPDLIANF